MNPVPEIAPEVRGLLEELVADPRSSLRLVPRRALRRWFDGGEVLRPREAGSTALERHLVSAHREALARLLYEASRIAYWKAPEFSHRPRGKDGHELDMDLERGQWSNRARGRLVGDAESVAILRAALDGPAPEQGNALAIASLALVPRIETRLYLALHLPRDSRDAIESLRAMSRHRMSRSMRSNVLSSLAARTASMGDFSLGRQLYRFAVEAGPHSPLDRLYSFNLCCFLGAEREALSDAEELSRLVVPSDPRLSEASGILVKWKSTRTPRELDLATRTIVKLMPDLPEVATRLGKVIAS